MAVRRPARRPCPSRRRSGTARSAGPGGGHVDQPRRSILFATTNRGKLGEVSTLRADLPLEILSLDTVLPNQPQVVEDGATFEENALRKARAAADAAMMV